MLVTKTGKEPGQGVGYLDDGTMVVVERGRDFVGHEVHVQVTSVLTTANGRLVFSRPVGEAVPMWRWSPSVRTAAVVPAAGRGERLGPGAPKALRDLAGQPLLVHAVRALAEARSVDVIVVAAPDGRSRSRCSHLLQPGRRRRPSCVVVTGGETRQQSVALALRRAPRRRRRRARARRRSPARARASSSTPCRAAVRAGADAVVPGVAVTDTIKQVDTAGRVEATVDRDALRAAQTPQGFARIVLESAHRAAAEQGLEDATDDAGLVEHFGRPVMVIPGSEDGFKVTRPIDLVLAEAVLARRRSAGVH